MIAMIIRRTTTEGPDPLNPSLKTTDTKPDQTTSTKMKEEITGPKIVSKDLIMTQSLTDNREHTTEPKITTEATIDATNSTSETTSENKDPDWNHTSNPANPEVKANKEIEATTKIIVSNFGEKITTLRGSFLQLNKSKIMSMLERNPISRICTLS